LLAERAGLFVKTSCATSLAAARELAGRGEIAANESVVLIATGTGYTERDVGDAPTPDPACRHRGATVSLRWRDHWRLTTVGAKCPTSFI